MSQLQSQLENYGKSLIGKTAQSRLLTGIGWNGKKFILPSQKITSFEIVESFQEPTLMVEIDGYMVYEDSIFNVN